jgi:hypothetical protein
LFLPWPTYRPDVTRVRITARYDVDGKPTLFGEESVFNLSPSAPSPITYSSEKFVPGQGLQSLLGQPGYVPAGTPLGAMGMGGLTPGSSMTSAFGSGSAPLGVIGSQANGAPMSNITPAVQPDPPMSISRVPVSSVPFPALQPSSAVPGTSGTVQVPGNSPQPDYRGLSPLGGGNSGLPPFASTATPSGR